MEKSVIDFIYYNDGELRKQIETDVEFEAVELRINRLAEKLLALLTEEQKEIFKRYEDAVLDEYNISTKLYFRMGLKLGVRVVAESAFD